MALSREDLKIIALTSAVAATAAAAATGLFEYILTEHIFKRETGPTIVVVPVQQQPPPGVEMPPVNGNGNGTVYAGFGALSPRTRDAMFAARPVCWSEQFDKCLEDANRYAPECRQYEPFHVAYDEDEDEYGDIMTKLDFCDVTKGQMVRNVAIAGGVGLLGGIALSLLLS